MHGVKRQVHNEEVRKRKLARDAVKIKHYKALTEKVLALKDEADYSSKAFELNTELLELNPEFYTMWNYRREIISTMTEEMNSEQKCKLFNNELGLTMKTLKSFPKCYWVWNYRRWVLENHVKADWDTELMTVTKIQERDARNFHSWHYRRYIINQIEVERHVDCTVSEFEYTTKLINENFSNYSALHNRTKLVEIIFAKLDSDPHFLQNSPKIAQLFADKLTFLKSELDYFKNAIYTDPEDQSVWLYLNWLLTSEYFLDTKQIPKSVIVDLLKEQVSVIEDLNELEKDDNGVDNKWCLKAKFEIDKVLSAYSDDSQLQRTMKETLEALVLVDPYRKNRYLEMLGK